MGFKISPFHMEIAKRVAQGQTNKQIKQDIQISDTRLSVLKANIVFQRQVDRFEELEKSKYRKALEVLGDKAKKAAEELVKVAESDTHPKKLDAITQILDRVAQSEGMSGGEKEHDEGDMIFEQRLRVVKKGQLQSITPDNPHDETGDIQGAIKQLNEDLKDAKSAKAG